MLGRTDFVVPSCIESPNFPHTRGYVVTSQAFEAEPVAFIGSQAVSLMNVCGEQPSSRDTHVYDTVA